MILFSCKQQHVPLIMYHSGTQGASVHGRRLCVCFSLSLTFHWSFLDIKFDGGDECRLLMLTIDDDDGIVSWEVKGACVEEEERVRSRSKSYSSSLNIIPYQICLSAIDRATEHALYLIISVMMISSFCLQLVYWL